MCHLYMCIYINIYLRGGGLESSLHTLYIKMQLLDSSSLATPLASLDGRQ